MKKDKVIPMGLKRCKCKNPDMVDDVGVYRIYCLKCYGLVVGKLPKLTIEEIDPLTCSYCGRLAPEKEFLTKKGCLNCDVDYHRNVRLKGE